MLLGATSSGALWVQLSALWVLLGATSLGFRQMPLLEWLDYIEHCVLKAFHSSASVLQLM